MFSYPYPAHLSFLWNLIVHLKGMPYHLNSLRGSLLYVQWSGSPTNVPFLIEVLWLVMLRHVSLYPYKPCVHSAGMLTVSDKKTLNSRESDRIRLDQYLLWWCNTFHLLLTDILEFLLVSPQWWKIILFCFMFMESFHFLIFLKCVEIYFLF